MCVCVWSRFYNVNVPNVSIHLAEKMRACMRARVCVLWLTLYTELVAFPGHINLYSRHVPVHEMFVLIAYVNDSLRSYIPRRDVGESPVQNVHF